MGAQAAWALLAAAVLCGTAAGVPPPQRAALVATAAVPGDEAVSEGALSLAEQQYQRAVQLRCDLPCCSSFYIHLPARVLNAQP